MMLAVIQRATFNDFSYPRSIKALHWTCKMNWIFSNSVTSLFGRLELSINKFGSALSILGLLQHLTDVITKNPYLSF